MYKEKLSGTFVLRCAPLNDGQIRVAQTDFSLQATGVLDRKCKSPFQLTDTLSNTAVVQGVSCSSKKE